MFELNDLVEDGFGDQGRVIVKNHDTVVVRFNSNELRTYTLNGKINGSTTTFSAFDIRKID